MFCCIDSCIFVVMENSNRYKDFSSFIRKKFDRRVQKVSLDAGFTCPNKDGTKGLGGCTYCNNILLILTIVSQ